MKMAMLVFDDFELLDVFGPLEMLGQLKESLSIDIVAERTGAISSVQGVEIVANRDFTQGIYDIIMVPGGQGTRREVSNPALLQWIVTHAWQCQYLCSVCTGAALLAKAGVLDGKRATTNKLAFDWVVSQSDKVDWVRKARWVQDGNIFTSAGVSAGMDMSLALISHIWGEAKAHHVADYAEYEWKNDPESDAFADKYTQVT
ncbi:DJ-1/PfpI family protein [Vibrio sp. SM6]|uniref:DJ-1/PfpI family protein n=1 Tax=Vibrio agarilyticus TaxID=2726741 RepID=A0A7X8TNC1_9VIBR|nr:DJ-1/PfpI family protein [Vibrio agarilyticus]NLS11699.1 DJ-1/PfpI family protein [Vibrio agarilyticus]